MKNAELRTAAQIKDELTDLMSFRGKRKRASHVRNMRSMLWPILTGLEKLGCPGFYRKGQQVWFHFDNQLFKGRFHHPDQPPVPKKNRLRSRIEIVQMKDGRTDGPVIKRFFGQAEADAFAINPML